MRLLIPEIFDRVQKATTVEQRKAILLQNNTPVLQDVLKINFHPAVKLNLPEGAPPFKREKAVPTGLAETNLYREMRRFYTWISPPPNLTKTKSEILFIQMLEAINLKEAELVIAIKDRKLTDIYPAVTEDLVRETFPGILPPKTESVVAPQQEVVAPPKKRGRPKKDA